MPLLDHFRPPLSARRHWHAFHNTWATSLAADLNQRLPEGYFAEPNVQFGIEIDVAALAEAPSGSGGIGRPEFATPMALTGSAGGWEVPAPTQTIPISIITDIVEVVVFDGEGGPTLAAAIELVSPANKDRPAHRNAFVYQCAAYLQQGIGLILVDRVTDRKANLHDELLACIGEVAHPPWEAELYAAAYRPVLREGEPIDALYVVVKGAVELRGMGGTLLAADGQAFGTWALIDQSPSVVEAKTRDPSRLLRITRDDFQDLVADHPELAIGLLQGLARRMRTIVS